MNAHKQGWFTEIGAPKGSHVALSVRADKLIHEEKSKYQDITVFHSELFGNCLALDNAIQCTQMDEFSYQEMIAFLPLNSHSNPSKVLIIGGGDGGVARECLKHPDVKKLVQCEIDDRVIQVSKQYFPSIACSYKDPKLELVVGDGYKYVGELPDESFDVIITDSSDPTGPAECLFKRPYYELLKKKLAPNGIICCQAESIWFDLEFIAELLKMNREIFRRVGYASTMTCSYPGGQIGFILCTDDETTDFKKPRNWLDEDSLGFKYYRKEVHEAAFVLPKFVHDKLSPYTEVEEEFILSEDSE